MDKREIFSKCRIGDVISVVLKAGHVFYAYWYWSEQLECWLLSAPRNQTASELYRQQLISERLASTIY